MRMEKEEPASVKAKQKNAGLQGCFLFIFVPFIYFSFLFFLLSAVKKKEEKESGGIVWETIYNKKKEEGKLIVDKSCIVESNVHMVNRDLLLFL